jgi:hypothetical protein
MKLFRCDACKQVVEATTYDGPPSGWYSLTYWESPLPSIHICSPPCLMRLAELDVERAPVPVSSEEGARV